MKHLYRIIGIFALIGLEFYAMSRSPSIDGITLALGILGIVELCGFEIEGFVDMLKERVKGKVN